MSLRNESKPLVSVVMGVHNEAEEHLRMALDSICNQTYPEIEFIIVDDFSNEECKRVLSEYSDRHSYIRVIHNDENLGLTKSLNIGLSKAAGEFIARMDADDFSTPNRIAKQVEFLIDSPEIDFCGTGVVSFGDSEVFMSPSKGLTNDEAQCCLFFSSTLCHPSVMIRKSFLEHNNLSYDENVKRGQDYDLWERASVFGKLAVLKEVLLFYRLHPAQITSSHKEEQDYYADRIRLRRLSRLGLFPTKQEYACHLLLTRGVDRKISVQDVRCWCEKIIDANDRKGLVDRDVLRNDLKDRFVMYKLRNRYFKSLTSFDDLCRLFSLFSARIQMKRGIKKATRFFCNLSNNG